MEGKIKNICSYSANAKWNDDFAEEVKKYKFVKQVFLDGKSKDAKEINIIKRIEDELNENGANNNENFENILHGNRIFKFDINVDFSVRRISYYFENGKIVIKDCMAMFLFMEEGEFSEFLRKFTDEACYDNITMKFMKTRLNDKVRDCCVKTVEWIAEDDYKVGIDKVELENFFKDRTVIYSGEMAFDEIRDLRKAINDEDNPFISYVVKGILVMFVGGEDLYVGTMASIIKDVCFYVGARATTDCLQVIRVDESYDVPKVRVILVK